MKEAIKRFFGLSKCINCNRKLKVGEIYCVECGQDLSKAKKVRSDKGKKRRKYKARRKRK